MQKKKIILLTILILIILSIALLILNTPKPIPQTITEQAKANYTTQIGTQTYDITNAVLEPTDITPTISAGMIPIKWNGTNWEITTFEDTNWYNYANGKPAYIMLNDGYYQSELIQNMQDKELAKNAVGNDALVVPNVTDNNPTIYMYIPRFAYNAQGEILYIKQACSVAGTYTMPEVFSYQTEKMDFSLAGIWIEYIPLASTSAVNTKINNMTGENNQYGFIANTIATNANNEISYKNIMETYNQYITNGSSGTPTPTNEISSSTNNSNIVGADDSVRPLITDSTNPNRTILKITNTKQPEPIKAKAYYDKTEEKIKIEVTYRTNAITKILNSKGNILSENLLTADTGDEIIGNKTYKFIVIDNLGNQKQIQTSVTGLDIYIIESEDDLKLFRDAVNAGKTTANTKAYQIADVKMNEGKYTIDDTTADITFAEDAEKWVPIGRTDNSKNYIYQGVYYGNNHTISGMYINTTATNQGLFSKCTGTTINDLGIINSRITGGDNTGSIVGYISGNGNINNCYSVARLNCNANYIGGLIGYAEKANINNCYNESEINQNINTTYIGGMVGIILEGTIMDSYNIGNINGGSYSGGICGYASKSSKVVNLQNCYNRGTIIGNNCIGGISGGISASSSATISNCKNYGDISGGYSGGIVGQSNSNVSLNISNCSNTGTISRATYSGGIIGNAGSGASNSINITRCYNKGRIIGKDRIGGIVGYGYRVTVNKCYNIANIQGTSNYTGGIAGELYRYSNINNTYNIGNINGGDNSGGICGYINGSNIKNCYNKGSVISNGNSIGGINGTAVKSSHITYCYNTNVDINGSKYIGLICGQTDSDSVSSSGFLKGSANSYGIAYNSNTSKYNLNTGCSIYTSIESMPTIISVINSDNAFVEDTEGINNGYPLLDWQVQ